MYLYIQGCKEVTPEQLKACAELFFTGRWSKGVQSPLVPGAFVKMHPSKLRHHLGTEWKAVGIASPNPYAILSLEKATRKKSIPSLIAKHADDLLKYSGIWNMEFRGLVA
eukprot:gene17750-21170_t